MVDFIRLINRHFKEEHGLDFYGTKLFVSAKALGVICKKAIGMPAKEIIQAKLFAEVKRMLIYGNDSIEQIGFQLGSSQRSSFKTFFIQQSGLSPKAFRKRIGQGAIR